MVFDKIQHSFMLTLNKYHNWLRVAIKPGSHTLVILFPSHSQYVFFISEDLIKFYFFKKVAIEIIYQSLKIVVKLKAEIKNDTNIFFKTICTWYLMAGLSQYYKVRKEILKGKESKNNYLQNMSLYIENKRLQILRLNKSSKASGFTINIWKLFL